MSDPLPSKTHTQIAEYYDTVYYARAQGVEAPSRHLRSLARRLNLLSGQELLDVGCGLGEWLMAAGQRQVRLAGVDLSATAIGFCSGRLSGEFHVAPAEQLPFADGRFDWVSSLGCLEHFVDPLQALREMTRVARPAARFLFLVPNAGFITRRLGLYGGTSQSLVKEEVRTLAEWETLFASGGLQVVDKWRDLHVLSASWILSGSWLGVPVRLLQALALPFWPLKWQYQVYFLCQRNPG